MKCKKFVSATLALVASLGLAACSGSSKDTSVRIGVIQYAEHSALSSARSGFLEALEEAGYTEGKNLTVDYQNAQGDQANLQTMVEKFANKNTLNFAIATPAAQALLNADPQTPAVFTAVTDPVSADLVNSLSSPGGTMTGSIDAVDVAAQMDFLLKAVPSAQTVGIFYNSSEVNSQIQAQTAQKALEEKGIKVVVKTVTSTNDVQQAMTSLANQVDAIYLPADNTVASTIATIGEVVKEAKVPTMGSDEAVLEGVLFTYGVDYHAIGVQAGEIAVRILKGEKPSEIAVESPKSASIAVNEEMASLLGVDASNLKNLQK